MLGLNSQFVKLTKILCNRKSLETYFIIAIEMTQMLFRLIVTFHLHRAAEWPLLWQIVIIWLGKIPEIHTHSPVCPSISHSRIVHILWLKKTNRSTQHHIMHACNVNVLWKNTLNCIFYVECIKWNYIIYSCTLRSDNGIQSVHNTH